MQNKRSIFAVVRNGKIDKYLFEGGYAQASVATSTTDNFAFFYYNRDHLGSIREVVDANGNIRQVTNYYPFGAPYADSPVNPDHQPYKYNGKELDRMHGLDTYDYGARQHDPILARWDRMDLLCEKTPGISPYVYCGNSPVRYVDPDGRDDYDVNRDGTLTLKRQTKSSTDMLISKNKQSIEVSKSFIQSHNHITVNARGSKSIDDNVVFKANIDMYSISDIERATPIYEFLKNNTDVEWSKTVVGNSNEKNVFISTTHDEQNEVGQSIIATVITEGTMQAKYPNISKYTDIYDASHSHSLGNITVSLGDVKLAKMIQSKFPQATLSIYDGNAYYGFDKTSEAGLLPDVFCVGKTKH